MGINGTNRRRRSIEFFEMWKAIPNTPENKEERAELFKAYREALKAEVTLAKLWEKKRKDRKRKEKQEQKVAPLNAGIPREWLERKTEGDKL